MRRVLPLSLVALLALPLAGSLALAQQNPTAVVPNQTPAQPPAYVQSEPGAQAPAPVSPAPVQQPAPIVEQTIPVQQVEPVQQTAPVQQAEPVPPAAPAQGVPVQAAPAQAPAESVPPPGVARPEDPNWPGNLQNWDSAPRNVIGDPGEAERRGLTAPDIQSDVQPTEQGNRAPEVLEKEAGEGIDLYMLLARVRSAPPGLDGQPIPRPNALASEPEIEMQPAQPRDANLFPENYIE